MYDDFRVAEVAYILGMDKPQPIIDDMEIV